MLFRAGGREQWVYGMRSRLLRQKKRRASFVEGAASAYHTPLNMGRGGPEEVVPWTQSLPKGGGGVYYQRYLERQAQLALAWRRTAKSFQYWYYGHALPRTAQGACDCDVPLRERKRGRVRQRKRAREPCSQAESVCRRWRRRGVARACFTPRKHRSCGMEREADTAVFLPLAGPQDCRGRQRCCQGQHRLEAGA